jgi:hypothetical protein
MLPRPEGTRMPASFRTVSPRYVDMTLPGISRNANTPWIAAHFAILNVGADDVGFDVDFNVLTAVRARHHE